MKLGFNLTFSCDHLSWVCDHNDSSIVLKLWLVCMGVLFHGCVLLGSFKLKCMSIASITLIFFFLTKFRGMYCIQQNSVGIWMHTTSFDALRNTSISIPYTSAWCLILDINCCIDHVHILFFSQHFNLEIMTNDTFQPTLQFSQYRLEV